uniref:Single-stranded DNA binding protein Ssb-like OB fold domain-containing protein n=1 Tax=Leersia perrieri TaxID=77586 RepID=A0A0D9WKS0_9ORYZ
MSSTGGRPFNRRGGGGNYVARPRAPNPPAPAAAPPAPRQLRKPVFTTVEQLRPQTHGHNFTARVLSSRIILDNPPPRARVAECLVGDHTGTVLFTARNQQVDVVKPGTTVIFRNAKIDMFKGTMRLTVDKWGRIEVTEPATFQVNQDNNVSLVEYELVDVADED